MLWALLAVLIFGGAGGGFGEKMFGKDTRALVGEAVTDPARAEVAVGTLKRGDKDLKAVAKELGRIAKSFSKADKAQAAGLDELTPFMKRASEQRRLSQEKGLDCIFALRGTLTAQEWDQVFAGRE